MYQTIGEKIWVAGVYKGTRFQPRTFVWRQHRYPISEVTFVADLRDGATRRRQYSVTSGANAYRLLFNRDEETWQLAEVWVES